jgi:Flp pilus assembly protein TadG
MKMVKRSEQGQVLILLTAGIITLLAFTGLAIDGGRLYAEKRAVQGASDTTSLTGAVYLGRYTGAITEDVKSDAIAAAIFRAVSNGYPVEDVSVTIQRVGSYYDVSTIIQSQIPPTISQIVFNGPLQVRAKSVARVYRVLEFGFGNALYAMSPTQKNALEFTGSGTIEILGAGMYSNSGHSTNYVTFSGSSISVLTDDVTGAGGIYVNKPENVQTPDGDQFSDYNANIDALGDFYVPQPDCSGMAAGTRTNIGGEIYFTPGVYSNITENSHSTYHFASGFYCINGAFTTANGDFSVEEDGGVSFYVSTGNVSLGGNVSFIAATDGSAVDSSGQNWNGMLLHIADGRLTINGNSDSYYEGTIYVPTPANPSCKLNGNSDSDGYNLQMICDSINVNGDGNLVIEYDGSNSYIPPVKIDLFE